MRNGEYVTSKRSLPNFNNVPDDKELIVCDRNSSR